MRKRERPVGEGKCSGWRRGQWVKERAVGGGGQWVGEGSGGRGEGSE